jgi:hypothetical protein
MQMDATLRLGDLLQGALAALVGLVGAVTAAWMIVRHERATRSTADAAAREDAARQARLRALTDMIAACGSLLAELVRPQFLVGRARIRMFEANANLLSVTWDRHRPVALWSQVMTGKAVELAGAHTKYWLLPNTTKRKRAAGQLLGEMMAALSLWADGGIDDAWFTDDLRRRDQAGPSAFVPPKQQPSSRG